MALRRHPRAPAYAAVVGFSGAVGIAASHLAPHWSSLSDPYPDLSVDALSWAVMLVEIAAALVLGIVALRELTRRPQHPSHPSASATRTLRPPRRVGAPFRRTGARAPGAPGQLRVAD